MMPPSMQCSLRHPGWLALGLSLSVGLSACGKKAKKAPPAQLRVSAQSSLPTSPTDSRWRSQRAYEAKLILQDMVEPRQKKVTTASVQVRAMSDGKRLAVQLTWADSTKSDLPGARRFSDGCAIQFPAGLGAEVPAPQMGEKGQRVEIAYWRASWQANADGRPDTIKALYPGAAVDHYPAEAHSLKKDPIAQKKMALRYAPSRALGNKMGGSRKRPVQDLVAAGPGTLRTAPKNLSSGQGRHKNGQWQVLINRPVPARLQQRKRTQIAFAIWEGAQREVGARKMRTAWIPISLEN